MIRATKSAFNKLTVQAIKDAVASDGIQIYSGSNKPANDIAHVGPATTTPAPTPSPVTSTAPTDDQLVDLVLDARNENRGDSAHVADAQKLVDTWQNSILPQPAPTPTPTPAPTPTPVPTPTNNLNVTDPMWLGDWSGDIWNTVHTACANLAPNQTALFVLYNIPGRDNGNYSAGGLATPQQYYDWVGAIADAIGTSSAICIVEPDALGLLSGLPTQQLKDDRIAMLDGAVKALKAKANTQVYVDASMWVNPSDMANMLKSVGQGLKDGFSCNVSGYTDTPTVSAWADQVAEQTGLKYVMDTSRNGNGNPHAPMWCNVTDTKVGVTSTSNTGLAHCAAFLWVKVPGQSDGLGINDDGSHPRTDVPSAGTTWPDYQTAIYSGDWTAFKAKYHV